MSVGKFDFSTHLQKGVIVYYIKNIKNTTVEQNINIKYYSINE